MSNYPWGYPEQRLIVGGVDLTTEFQMILIDGFELNPPEPKFYMIDIPGGNGTIDLTEALGGDVSYKNRQQQFTFKLIYPAYFELTKTKLSNFLHGKYFEYRLTWDPEYTYRGRFQIVSYSHIAKARGKLAEIVIKVEADPYKYKESPVIYVNGIGGSRVPCPSGRKPVRPVIQCSRPITVTWEGNTFTVPEGTHRLNDVLFHEGYNELYFNTFSILSTKWEDLYSGGVAEMTWNEAKEYTWDQLQALTVKYVEPNAQEFSINTLDGGSSTVNDGTSGVYAKAYTWLDLYGDFLTWDYLRKNGWTWDGINADNTVQGGIDGTNSSVYITYEWGDL